MTADETLGETPAAASAGAPDAPRISAPPRFDETTVLSLYERFGHFPGPALVRWLLSRRAAAGKEDPARLGERFGHASAARPDGRLMWFHAASVGETLSLEPLLARLRSTRPETTLLLTTGTRSSAAIAAERAPAGVIHQYAPIDLPHAAGRFLDHWRPDFFGAVESEIWPSTLAAAKRRAVPTALLSARLSARSAASWARAPRTIAALLGRFDLVMSQTEEVALRLRRLGAPADRLRVSGSLKDAAAPLPADPTELARLRAAIGDRPLWIAASTHAGEEAAAVAAHRALAERFPGLLTLIAPRHPERADAAVAAAAAAGLTAARRSARAAPAPEDAVFVIDRLGELGLWFRLAPVALIGGSLGLGPRAIGGHNPMEPARLGAAVAFGPDMANFVEERRRLLEAGAAVEAPGPDAIAAVLGGLIGSAAAVELGLRARAAAEAGGADVLARYEAAVLGLCDRPREP